MPSSAAQRVFSKVEQVFARLSPEEHVRAEKIALPDQLTD
jgi:hypothetical protein